MIKKTNLIGYGLLLIFLILGLWLRIYKLSEVPQGFNWDEAANGYNAYSLLKTGKDEFGKPWPLMMKSFGEYKTGIGSIILVPVIKVLGLSVFSVRLPNAILGSFLILAVFYLSLQIFKQIVPASLTAGLIAISPWAIHTSRFALEWYLGLPLMILGISLLIDENKNKFRLPLAAILLASSLYFYASIKLVLPLLLLTYIIIYRQALRRNIKGILIGIFLGTLTLLPLLMSMKNNNWLNRAKKVSIFNETKIDELNEGLYRYTIAALPSPFIRVINNKLVFFGKELADKYLQVFSVDFLLLGKEPSPMMEIPQVGKIYLISLPFLILGIFEAIKKKSKADKFLLTWLLLAPIPSILTTDSPHSLRAILLLPVLEIFVVKGFLYIYVFFKQKIFWIKTFFISGIALIYLSSLCFFLWRYFLFYPEYTAEHWLDGHKEVVEKINSIKGNYDRVIFTISRGQPHIFYAFFTPVNPELYQQEAAGQQNIFNAYLTHLNGIEFKKDIGESYCLNNALIIDEPGKLEIIPRLDIVYYKNRFHKPKAAFELFDTNNPIVKEYLCPKKPKV